MSVYARYYVNGAKLPPFKFLHDLVNDPDQRDNLALKLKDSAPMKEILALCDKLIAEAGPAMKDIGENHSVAPNRKKRPSNTVGFVILDALQLLPKKQKSK